jgi:predicted metal-dependent enzyme (double-stranded beta helix superfamily)
MNQHPHPTFQALAAIDWTSTASILAGCTPAYDAITADPALLARLLDHLPGDGHLAPMCERYDFLDKLVLHDDTAAQVRVRLHLYRPGYFDRPHPHRWDFFAGIYRGSYLHRIFGRATDFNEDTDPRTLRPLIERIEGPGSTYALDHDTVHTVQAEADTISILIRGPATADRFLILDAETGRSFWVYGAAHETPLQRAAKQMTASQLTDTITRVRQLTGLDTGTGSTTIPDTAIQNIATLETL